MLVTVAIATNLLSIRATSQLLPPTHTTSHLWTVCQFTEATAMLVKLLAQMVTFYIETSQRVIHIMLKGMSTRAGSEQEPALSLIGGMAQGSHT